MHADLWVSSPTKVKHSLFRNLGLILSIILSKVLAQTADSSKKGAHDAEILSLSFSLSSKKEANSEEAEDSRSFLALGGRN